MLSLGSYPEVSLAMARTKRDDARRLIAEGKDPSQHKKDEKLKAAVAARNTFGAVAEEVPDTLEEGNAAERTIEKNRWLLLDLDAPIADRPVAEITPAEVLALLKKVEKSGRRETAKRLQATIARVFRLAVATLRASTNPTYAFRGALAAPYLPGLSVRSGVVNDIVCPTRSTIVQLDEVGDFLLNLRSCGRIIVKDVSPAGGPITNQTGDQYAVQHATAAIWFYCYMKRTFGRKEISPSSDHGAYPAHNGQVQLRIKSLLLRQSDLRRVRIVHRIVV
jgi:hypothetical protein